MKSPSSFNHNFCHFWLHVESAAAYRSWGTNHLLTDFHFRVPRDEICLPNERIGCGLSHRHARAWRWTCQCYVVARAGQKAWEFYPKWQKYLGKFSLSLEDDLLTLFWRPLLNSSEGSLALTIEAGHIMLQKWYHRMKWGSYRMACYAFNAYRWLWPLNVAWNTMHVPYVLFHVCSFWCLLCWKADSENINSGIESNYGISYSSIIRACDCSTTETLSGYGSQVPRRGLRTMLWTFTSHAVVKEALEVGQNGIINSNRQFGRRIGIQGSSVPDIGDGSSQCPLTSPWWVLYRDKIEWVETPPPQCILPLCARCSNELAGDRDPLNKQALHSHKCHANCISYWQCNTFIWRLLPWLNSIHLPLSERSVLR